MSALSKDVCFVEGLPLEFQIVQICFFTVCKSRHEPIGVRGFFFSALGSSLKILGRGERTKEEKQM